VDEPQLTLALVEAQVGSLVEVLPVALLVASASGEILRANEVAVELLNDCRGQAIRKVLPFMGEVESEALIRGAIYSGGRIHALQVRLRWLRHGDDVLRLYVIHDL
jgi:hypothetical protein